MAAVVITGDTSGSANTDYQAFLRWCEEGNTPEPADQGEQA